MEAEELLKAGEEEVEHRLTPFERKVAMTMAIIAALLAVITMLSHRAHTESLSSQEEANSLRTQAGILHTRASDQWAYFQAKNIRSTEYQGFLGLLDALAKSPGASEQKTLKLQEKWGADVRRYEGKELPELKAQAEALVSQARQFEGQAQQAVGRSYDAHFRGERYDLAELGVEIALVLCSLAVLTKSASFWYAGIGFGAAGLLIALSALMMA
jgi:Domain of unknown function (DUF4337)